MGQCEEVGRKALTIIGSEAVLFVLFFRAALSLRVNLPFPLKKHFHISVYIYVSMFEIPCNANISCNALVLILYAGYAF